jgi:hypothetical protein
LVIGPLRSGCEWDEKRDREDGGEGAKAVPNAHGLFLWNWFRLFSSARPIVWLDLREVEISSIMCPGTGLDAAQLDRACPSRGRRARLRARRQRPSAERFARSTLQEAALSGRDGADGGYITALITKDGKAIGNITRAD